MDVNQPINVVPEIEPVSNSRSKPNERFVLLLTLFSLLLLVCGVSVVFGITYFRKAALLRLPTISHIQQTPFPILEGFEYSDDCESLSYINKTQLQIESPRQLNQDQTKTLLLNFGDTDFLKSLTNASIIEVMDYSPTVNVVAYIEGASWKVGENRQVYIYDVHTNTKTLVYELETRGTGSEYMVEIKDLKFSPDGSLLAVTTSDSLFTYNTITKQLTPKFHYPADENSLRVLVFGYTPRSFSEDNSKLFISRGFWEGHEDFILDLSSNKATELTFVSKYGDRIFGWSGDQLVVASSYQDISHKAALGLISLDGKFVATLSATPKLYESLASYANKMVLHREVSSVPSGEYVCNNVSWKYQVETQTTKVSGYDLETRQEINYFEVDSTNSSGVTDLPVRVLDARAFDLLGSKQVVVKLDNKGEEGYYLAFPDRYNTLQPLVLSP